MNNTLKKIVASITVLTCAVWMMGPGIAQALTVDELLALIAGADDLEDLQADIAAAQAAEEEEEAVTIEGVPADFTFETNLKLTDTGDDVKYLQIVLNSDSDTQLAEEGVVGSAGNETSYFGPLTKAAVITFQELYTEDCLASWGLTEGTGFVGSTTRAKLNSLLAVPVVPTGCECTDWEGVACGGGDCLATEMQQTRTCEPEEGAAEDVCEDVVTSQCVEDETCVVSEGLTVALAADTPVTTALPYDSSSEFLKFTLISDEAVNISSITITAGGLGTYTNIDDVAIFDEDGIRVSSTKNVSSDGNVVFNFPTPLAVETGVLQTLTVKASVPVAGSSSVFYLGISASSDILSDASAVNGTFPINGNSMNILGVTVGTATITAAGDLAPTVSFGEDDVLLADFDIDVGTAEDLLFSAIRFRNGGTNDDSLASNLRLICDGEEVSTTELEDRYADFSVSNLLLEKSDTITCEVRGDIGTGSIGNTIQLYLKYDSDVTILCKNTGLRADVDTSNLNTIAEAQTVTLAAGDFTIDFDRSSATGTPNQDIRPDTNNVVLATLKMTSNAENATIEAITGDASDQFEIQGAGLAEADITAGSVEMRDVDTGSIYDLAETWVSDTEWYLSMTEEISLLKGVTKTFEIRLDLTSSIGDEDTLKIVLEDGAMIITGDVSGEDIGDILPSSVTSAISTVEVSSLTVTTTTLTDVSLVAGATDVIIYQGSMEAGDSSLVTLKTVTISEVSADTYTAGTNVALFSDTNITKLDLYLDGDLMKTRSNRIVEAATDTGMGSITFSSLDTNNVISAGATVSLVLKATFASTLNAAGTFALGVTSQTTDVISRDVDNDLIVETITVATTAVESRTVDLATVGTLKVDLLNTDIKANKDMYIVAGSSGPTGRYLGELVFNTTNEPVRVTELRLVQEGTTDTDDIVSVSLVEADGDVVVTKAVDSDGNVVLTNADLEFAADEATSYFIVANTKGINVKDDPTSTTTSGRTIQYSINATNGVVAEGIESNEDIVVSGITLLEAATNNTATWSTTQVNDGNYSVALAGTGDGANAMIAYGETLATLAALTTTKGAYTVLDVEFHFYAPSAGNVPFAMLYVDEDDDGTVDTLISGGFDVDGSTGLPMVWTAAWFDAYKTSAATWVLDNPPTVIGSYVGCYTGGLTTPTLAQYLADTACADVIVTHVGIGAYQNANIGYADDVIIGGVTYSMEASNVATVLGGAVTWIENDMADGGKLVPGAGKIIGEYKLSIDTGSNRNTDNTPMEIVLTELKITLASSLTLDKEGDAGTSVGDVRAYIEGDSSNKTPALGETDETTFSTPEYTISLDSLAGEAYKVTDDVVLVIVALVEELTATAGVTDYLQTEIDALSTDFTYTDGTTTALDKLTIDEVIGATLVE